MAQSLPITATDPLKTNQAATDETLIEHGSAQLQYEDKPRKYSAIEVDRVFDCGFMEPSLSPQDPCRIRIQSVAQSPPIMAKDPLKTNQAATDETLIEHGSAQLQHEDKPRKYSAIEVDRVLGCGFMEPSLSPQDPCRIGVQSAARSLLQNRQ